MSLPHLAPEGAALTGTRSAVYSSVTERPNTRQNLLDLLTDGRIDADFGHNISDWQVKILPLHKLDDNRLFTPQALLLTQLLTCRCVKAKPVQCR